MMQFLFLSFLASFTMASGPMDQTLQLSVLNPEGAFKQFVTHFQKDYLHQDSEYAKRFSIFKANADYITRLNSRNGSFKLALNEFADMEIHEFVEQRTGLKADLSSAKNDDDIPSAFRPHGPGYLGNFKIGDSAVPSRVDWREEGMVSPVKNQGACGSCWAFSAIGSVESANAIHTGEMVELSEQELVDCAYQSSTDGCCYGCGGGLMDPAYDFIVTNGGVDTEEYHYWGEWGMYCNTRKMNDRHVVSIDGYVDIPAGDEKALTAALAQQPVAVAICVDANLQFYQSGVIDYCCDMLNHGVLAVGYGVDEDSGKETYIVKNSWGSAWGDNGYFLLERNSEQYYGMCGIATAPSMPIKHHKNPENVPEICDYFGFWECPASTECCCKLNFFNLVCLWPGCCEGDVSTTADSIVQDITFSDSYDPLPTT